MQYKFLPLLAIAVSATPQIDSLHSDTTSALGAATSTVDADGTFITTTIPGGLVVSGQAWSYPIVTDDPAAASSVLTSYYSTGFPSGLVELYSGDPIYHITSLIGYQMSVQASLASASAATATTSSTSSTTTSTNLAAAPTATIGMLGGLAGAVGLLLI